MNRLIGQLTNCRSLDIEQLLEFDACTPIIISHLVTEVLLERINRVTGNHGHDIGLVVEMTSVLH